MNGRYAPSPTGVLHLGNLRTALLAWLFARSAGSEFVLRSEDLDTGRVRREFYAEQQRDLRAIGLDWDAYEVQSQYASPHEEALERLPVYECFCTRAEIREAASAAHGPVGAYPGTCLGLSESERAARRADGREPALRVRAGAARVHFVDRALGARRGRRRRLRGAPQRRRARLQPRGRDRRPPGARRRGRARRRPAGLDAAADLALPHARAPGAGVCACAFGVGADGKRLAKRHGSVTLRDLEVDEALAWMARSLGFRRTDPVGDAREFDPAQLPHEPTRLRPIDSGRDGRPQGRARPPEGAPGRRT